MRESDKANRIDENEFRRRAFLSLVGVTGAAGLAGCTGGGDGGDGSDGGGDGSDGGSDGGGGGSDGGSDGGGGGSDGGSDGNGDGGSGVADVEYVWQTIRSPGQQDNWNPWAANYGLDFGDRMYFDDLTFRTNQSSDLIFIGLLEDATLEDDTLEVNIHPDATWKPSGDPVTAEDLDAHYTLWRYVDGWPEFMDSTEIVDEKTLRINLTKAINPSIGLQQMIATQMQTKASIFEDFLERLDGLDPESEEAKSIREEIVGTENESGFQIDLKDAQFTGPFMPEELRSANLTGVRNPDYHRAENITFERTRGHYFGETQKLWQSLRTAGDIDITTNAKASPEITDTFPDSIKEIRWSNYSGVAIRFQHRNDIFRNLNVRKAIAWAINRESIRNTVRPDKGVTVKKPYILQETQRGDYWMSDEVTGNSEGYGMAESNFERAAELLEAEGFSKQDGTWYKPDGSPWQVVLHTNTVSDWNLTGELAVGQLSEFGIDIELKSVSQSSYWGTVYLGGEWDQMAIAWAGGWTNAHPYWGYYNGLVSPWEHPAHNYPKPPGSEDEWIVESPRPVGDPNGDLEPVNIQDLMSDLETTQDEERERELVSELSWTFNQDLPHLPIEDSRKQQQFVNTERWNWPEDGDEAWYYGNDGPAFALPRTGKVTPNQ